MAIWLTSDLHFGHNKNFLYEPRGFNSIDEHNDIVLKNLINTIGEDDEVYILGDLMLNDNDAGIAKIAQIPGHIHIILGNHDSAARIELYKQLPNVVDIQYATMIKYKKANFYLSHYPTICSNDIDQGPWHQNIINLYGHTHQQDNFYSDNPYMYHVGLDSHNCFPIEIEDIIEDIKKQKERIL